MISQDKNHSVSLLITHVRQHITTTYCWNLRGSAISMALERDKRNGFRLKRHIVLKSENSSFEWCKIEYDSCMLSWCKFVVKMNAIFNLFFHADRNQELKPILYPVNLREFLCLKIVTWRLSVIRVAGRIANVTVFRSRVSAFRRQNLARRKCDRSVC